MPTLQRLLRPSLEPVAASETPELAPAAKSRVLVLAPTRELAVQIEDEIHGLSYHTTVTSAAIYGGVEMGAQERALRAGVDIIVATPGRLMDHMRQQNADLSGIDLLILDEADRMMDMGFWPDVRRIISAIPGKRQTLLFSATMPDDVVRLALEIVHEPKFVQVGQRSMPAKSITHRAHVVSSHDKLDWLTEHLRRHAGPVLVFNRTKVGAERLAQKLASHGIRCVALHADRTQEQRRAAVEGFRGGKLQGAGRHRHRGPRPRHRRHSHRDQLRAAGLGGCLRAPRRPNGTRRRGRVGPDAGRVRTNCTSSASWKRRSAFD